MISEHINAPMKFGLDDLMPQLMGKVFHVTPKVNLEKIRATEEIKANGSGTLTGGFGYSNGYFRKRNCVSLFDYRNIQGDDEQSKLYFCNPLHFLRENSPIAILYLLESAYHKLLPWTDWESESAYSDQIVPYIEVGYKDSIPLSEIQSILTISRPDDTTTMADILAKVLKLGKPHSEPH